MLKIHLTTLFTFVDYVRKIQRITLYLFSCSIKHSHQDREKYDSQLTVLCNYPWRFPALVSGSLSGRNCEIPFAILPDRFCRHRRRSSIRLDTKFSINFITTSSVSPSFLSELPITTSRNLEIIHQRWELIVYNFEKRIAVTLFLILFFPTYAF